MWLYVTICVIMYLYSKTEKDKTLITVQDLQM